jgi:hypothetical protein
MIDKTFKLICRSSNYVIITEAYVFISNLIFQVKGAKSDQSVHYIGLYSDVSNDFIFRLQNIS